MARDYPADWDSRRKTVYRRDNFTCQNCGARGGPNGNAELHAHHIIPKSQGGSHALSNLTTVCKACHEAIHGHTIGGGGPYTQQRRWPTWVDDPADTDPFQFTASSRPYVRYLKHGITAADTFDAVYRQLHDLYLSVTQAASQPINDTAVKQAVSSQTDIREQFDEASATLDRFIEVSADLDPKPDVCTAADRTLLELARDIDAFLVLVDEVLAATTAQSSSGMVFGELVNEYVALCHADYEIDWIEIAHQFSAYVEYESRRTGRSTNSRDTSHKTQSSQQEGVGEFTVTGLLLGGIVWISGAYWLNETVESSVLAAIWWIGIGLLLWRWVSNLEEE